MAVAIVNQDVTHANGNSFTAGAGSNRLLVFAGASVDTNQMPTGGSGTFGGTALLEAVDVAWDGGARKGIVRGYYLPEASIPAGAQVSAFTGDTTLETPYEGSVLTLSGVDQTTPIPATGIATITLDDVADTLNFAAPAGIAFLVSQHLGATMGNPAGWTLLSTYAPMTNGTQLKTWQRAFATADPAASVTLTGGGATGGRASVFCVAEAAAAGQTIPVGQVTESSLAQAVGSAKQRAAGLVSESDLSQSIGAAKAQAVGLVSELDVTFAVESRKARALGLVAETDLAQALASALTVQLGQIVESDLAQTIASAKRRTLAQILEADVAQAIQVATGLVVGQVAETDSALSLDASKRQAVGQIAEVDSVFSIGVQRVLNLLQVAESDTVFALAAAKLKALGLVTELDTAFAMAIVGGNAIGPVNNPGMTSQSVQRGIRSASVSRGMTSQSVQRGIIKH